MKAIIISGGTADKRLKKLFEIKLNISKTSRLTFADIFGSNLQQPDILLIEAKEASIGIDQCRELKKWLSRRPFEKKTKAGIIINAERLTQIAQNSLLKSLEELKINNYIFLLTSYEESLLPTIRSRCLLIKLPSESEINFKAQEKSELTEKIKKIMHLEPGKRLGQKNIFPKERQQIITAINKWLLIIREMLIEAIEEGQAKQAKTKQMLQALRSLILAKKQIEANCNKQLVIDNFLLGFTEEQIGQGNGGLI